MVEMNFGQALAQTIATILSLGLLVGVFWYVNRVRKQTLALIKTNPDMTVLGAVWRVIQTDLWPLLAVPGVLLVILALTLPWTEGVIRNYGTKSRSGSTIVQIVENPLDKVPILGWLFRNVPRVSLLGGDAQEEPESSVYVFPDQSVTQPPVVVQPMVQPTAAPPAGYVDEVTQEMKTGDDLLRAVFANAQNSASPSTIPSGWLMTVVRTTGFWIFQENRYWLQLVGTPGANFVGSRIEIRSRQVGEDWWKLIQSYPKADGTHVLEGTGMNWPPEPMDCPTCFTTRTVRVQVESGQSVTPPPEPEPSATPPPVWSPPPPTPTPVTVPSSTDGGCPSRFAPAPSKVWPEGTLHSDGIHICCGGKWPVGRSCP